VPVLTALLSACLAVGSGGAWFAGRTAVSEPAAQVTKLESRVDEHLRADDSRDAVLATKTEALEKQYDKLERKLDEANRKLDRLLLR